MSLIHNALLYILICVTISRPTPFLKITILEKPEVISKKYVRKYIYLNAEITYYTTEFYRLKIRVQYCGTIFKLIIAFFRCCTYDQEI